MLEKLTDFAEFHVDIDFNHHILGEGDGDSRGELVARPRESREEDLIRLILHYSDKNETNGMVECPGPLVIKASDGGDNEFKWSGERCLDCKRANQLLISIHPNHPFVYMSHAH